MVDMHVRVSKNTADKISAISQHFVATGYKEMTKTEVVRKACDYYCNVIARNIVASDIEDDDQ